jgi:glycerol uptake facilitator-like aquaporin
VVTLAEWWTGRRGGDGVRARGVAVYVPAQLIGAIAGAVLADAMFGEPLVKWSTHDRSAGHLLLGEVVATTGLILLIFGLARTDRLRFAPVAVASYTPGFVGARLVGGVVGLALVALIFVRGRSVG